MKIVSTAKLSSKHQRTLQEKFPEHQFYFFNSVTEADEAVLKEAEVWVNYGVKIESSIIEQMPYLKWMQILSAGVEKLPFAALEVQQVILTNARGIHGIQMAEYTFALLLNIVRNNSQHYENQKQAIWDQSIRVDELYGKTLGILGLGSIGTELAKRAKAFGMKVLGVKRNPQNESPDYIDEVYDLEEQGELFRQSDFVVCLLPLTPETHQCIGRKQLEQMKPTAYFVNIARGHVVDEAALITILQEKRIAGAILDVFQQEPLPKEHILWQLDNVVITPHVAGHSPHYVQRALAIFEENLSCYPDVERMKNVIDYQKRY